MVAGLRSIAKAMESPPEPTVRAPALDPTDERDVETEYGPDNEAPADERAGNRQARPNPPRHISTLPGPCLPGTLGKPKTGLETDCR